MHLEFDEEIWIDPKSGRAVRHAAWAGDYVYAVPECMGAIAIGDVVRVPHQHHPWCRTPDDPGHIRVTVGKVVGFGGHDYAGRVRTIECGHEMCRSRSSRPGKPQQITVDP